MRQENGEEAGDATAAHNRVGHAESIERVCDLSTTVRPRLTPAASLEDSAPMVKPTPNLDDLYVVLRSHAVAKPGQLCTYTELSHQYKARTGDWFEPHGSWDAPLGALNHRLHTAAAPALSAVVVLKGDPPEPGRGFWGSAPSVPPRPKSEMQRLTAWQAILQTVFVHPWPTALQ